MPAYHLCGYCPDNYLEDYVSTTYPLMEPQLNRMYISIPMHSENQGENSQMHQTAVAGGGGGGYHRINCDIKDKN